MRKIIKCQNDDIEIYVFNSWIKDSRKLIVVNSAMGANISKYQEMARFFNKHGWNLISYNYRGVGDFYCNKYYEKLHLIQWGVEDMNAVINWGVHYFKVNNLVIMGHSIGAQLIQYLDLEIKPNKIILFSGQKGYWKYWSNYLKIPMFLFWKMVLPVNVMLNNEFSLMKIAHCHPLPKQVALDWRIWALNKKFVDKTKKDISNYSRSLNHVPLLSIHISDDKVYAPKKAVEALLKIYHQSEIVRITLSPKHFKLKRLKHSGIFEISKTLMFWNSVLIWLEHDSVYFSLYG